MKTYYEIVANKNYRNLTSDEKEMIQDRQTALVIAWQDETYDMNRRVIEDELIDSFTGLIKGIAYKQSEKSFSVDQEEFEGLISLTLVETMIKFDRTLNKPFQPVFLTNVRYAILEMFRDKGYDLHDTSDRLNKTFAKVGSEGELEMSEFIASPKASLEDAETEVLLEGVLTDLFNDNETKKTIVRMTLQGFKRNEIVSAINTDGKAIETVAKTVNRTFNQFKQHYINLLNSHAV